MPYGRGPWFVVPARPAGGWTAPWRFPRGPQPRPEMEQFRRRVRAELDQSAAVLLNAQGGGFVTLAPDGMTAWRVRHAQVGTSSGPSDASQAFGYRSAVFPHRALFQTAQGGGDTISFEAVLRPGDTLICVWQGGNPGDTATLNITGSVYAWTP
jgi:hypothetical protein